MEDDNGDLDTPINYSLKYSDEQLNSGRQSPSQNERWARPKLLDDEWNDQIRNHRDRKAQDTPCTLKPAVKEKIN